jgi:peptidyl-prolyl cis-trans isomerase B (cyclophilin B)
MLINYPLSLPDTPVSWAVRIQNLEIQAMKKLLTLFVVMMMSFPVVHAQTDAQTGSQTEAENPQVTIHTNHGDIRLELFPQDAPISVANFLQYANDGFYDGTIFHRVISHFMIQGGGITPDMQRKPTREPITNEATNGLKNRRGTIAMARTNDEHSATSQFFINVEVNGALNHKSMADSREWGYTVFGKVIDGMDVVDDIRFVPTTKDVPDEVVLIESVEVH